MFYKKAMLRESVTQKVIKVVLLFIFFFFSFFDVLRLSVLTTKGMYKWNKLAVQEFFFFFFY